MKLKATKKIKYLLPALIVILVIAGLLVLVHRHQNPRAQPVSQAHTTVLANYQPSIKNGLITNEYAFFNSQDSTAIKSSNWQMTSGSLFAKDGYFWTGLPDSCDSPNAGSTNCTDSNVFRLNTIQQFSGNIDVSLSLKQNTNIHNPNCNSNDTCWHGTHIWLRYLNQYNLYYVSVNRSDGSVVIKRKVPCGDDNSGTYFVLGNYVNHDFKPGRWNIYSTSIETNSDGSVTIKLYDASYSKTQPIDIGIDRGGINPNWTSACTTPGKYPSKAYSPITTAGNVGIRGDYANFEFTNLLVTKLN